MPIGKTDIVLKGDFQLTNAGFARRVEAELDSLGYPENHTLRVAARSKYPAGMQPPDTHAPYTNQEASE